MKRVFVVHSPITYLTSRAVVESDQFGLDDVIMVGSSGKIYEDGNPERVILSKGSLKPPRCLSSCGQYRYGGGQSAKELPFTMTYN